MVTNAITLITPDVYTTFDQMAKDIVKSGFTKLTEFQIKFIFFKGLELGLSPMQALDGINNIAGKPTCSPQLMLALIYRSGQVEDMKITDDGQTCTVMMKRKGMTAHVETFSMDDASKIMTKEDGKNIKLTEKYNWRQMPKVMRKWRCVAACARIVYPDIIQNLLTHEEMGADVSVTEDGEMVVVSKPAEPPQSPVVQIPTTVEPQKVESPVVTNPPANPYAAATGKANKWTDAKL